MKRGLRTIVSVVVALVVWSAWTSYVHAATVWGETFGPAAATVERGDSPRGLAVRAEPAVGSRILGYLTVGTRVRGFRRFENGWMRIQKPMDQGWIPVDYLVPLSSSGHISDADTLDCVKVRSGPADRFKTVGCLPVGKRLTLTGVWSENNWAQIRWPIRGWLPSKAVTARFKPGEPSRIASKDFHTEPPRAEGYDRPGMPPYAYRAHPYGPQDYLRRYPVPRSERPYEYRDDDKPVREPRWGLGERPPRSEEAPDGMELGAGSYGVTFGRDQILRFQFGGVGGWVDLRGAFPRYPWWRHPYQEPAGQGYQ